MLKSIPDLGQARFEAMGGYQAFLKGTEEDMVAARAIWTASKPYETRRAVADGQFQAATKNLECADAALAELQTESTALAKKITKSEATRMEKADKVERTRLELAKVNAEQVAPLGELKKASTPDEATIESPGPREGGPRSFGQIWPDALQRVQGESREMCTGNHQGRDESSRSSSLGERGT